MVAHRIADPIILRLISKWLKAGALRDGVFIAAEEGTPQGGPISLRLSEVIETINPIISRSTALAEAVLPIQPKRR
jgi:retron-type reverse transcriptase